MPVRRGSNFIRPPPRHSAWAVCNMCIGAAGSLLQHTVLASARENVGMVYDNVVDNSATLHGLRAGTNSFPLNLKRCCAAARSSGVWRRHVVNRAGDRTTVCYNFTVIFSHYQISVRKRCDKSLSNLARIPSEVAAASFSSLLLWGARYQYS